MVMDARDRRVRLCVYDYFLDLQRPPSLSEIAARLGLSRDRVIASLHRLHADHVLVLESGKSDIRMAMPFSAVDTGVRVKARGKFWWANCAWDALGVPHILKEDAVIESHCPHCSEPIVLQTHGNVVSGNADLVHFEIPPAHFWDDIIHT